MTAPIKETGTLLSSLEKRSFLLTYAAAFIALLAPAGYLIGVGYQAGYLSTFGITTDAFPLSVTDAYVYGYYTVSFYLIELIPFFTDITSWQYVGAVLCALILFVYAIAKIARYEHPDPQKNKPLPPFLIRIKVFLNPNTNDFTLAIKLVAELSTKIGKAAYFTIILLTVWISITVFSTHKGQIHAEKNRSSFLSKSCFFQEHNQISNCVKIYDSQNNLIAEGILVALNDKRYGIFNQQGSLISELPKDASIIRGFKASTTEASQ